MTGEKVLDELSPAGNKRRMTRSGNTDVDLSNASSDFRSGV